MAQLWGGWRRLEGTSGVYLAVVALCVLALAPASDATSASMLGINYGRVGNNLPPPQAVLPLLQKLSIGRVRLYDPDPSVLRAFARTGVELFVGVPDESLAAVAEPGGGASWLKANILPFLTDTKIVALTVGNEVLTSNSSALMRTLLPAMESLHGALAAVGLDKQISVTTAHNLGVLGTSYPPSAGAFRKDLLPYLCPILDYHARTGSPFLANAYPYFAYSGDPKGVHLEYALLEPGYAGVPDPNTGLHYPNLLVAQVDAVYHAIAAANSAASRGVEVRVSETGWPSSGDANERAATPQNAARYNSNAMQLVAEGKGTPLKPGLPLRAYVFALFNENLKPGPASERNYGLFKPDSTPVYDLTYKPPRDNSTGGSPGGGSGGGGGGGGGGGIIAGNTTGGDNGYYDISAAPRGPTGREQGTYGVARQSTSASTVASSAADAAVYHTRRRISSFAARFSRGLSPSLTSTCNANLATALANGRPPPATRTSPPRSRTAVSSTTMIAPRCRLSRRHLVAIPGGPRTRRRRVEWSLPFSSGRPSRPPRVRRGRSAGGRGGA